MLSAPFSNNAASKIEIKLRYLGEKLGKAPKSSEKLGKASEKAENNIKQTTSAPKAPTFPSSRYSHLENYCSHQKHLRTICQTDPF